MTIDDALYIAVLEALERLAPHDDINQIAALNIAAEVQETTPPGDPKLRLKNWRRHVRN